MDKAAYHQLTYDCFMMDVPRITSKLNCDVRMLDYLKFGRSPPLFIYLQLLQIKSRNVQFSNHLIVIVHCLMFTYHHHSNWLTDCWLYHFTLCNLVHIKINISYYRPLFRISFVHDFFVHYIIFLLCVHCNKCLSPFPHVSVIVNCPYIYLICVWISQTEYYTLQLQCLSIHQE